MVSLLVAKAVAAPPSPGQSIARAVREVAVSGELPGGLSEFGAIGEVVGNPVIDRDGRVAFIAALDAEHSVTSVWIHSDGGLRLVAKSGDAAPSTGASFAHFSNLVIADGGSVAFKALLAGPPISEANRDTIWMDQAGVLRLIAQSGQKAPALATDLRFASFQTPLAASGHGWTAFFARTRDKEDADVLGSGLWIAGAGGAWPAAVAGGEAMAGDGAVVFSPQSFELPFATEPVISPAGETVFRGFLAGPGINEGNSNGLWSYSDAHGLRLLVLAGDEAAGKNGKYFVSFPTAPTINAAGDTAFLAFFGDEQQHQLPAQLELEGIAGDDKSAAALGLGLWLRRASGELAHLLAMGDPAPGISGDARFVDAFDPVMSASGRLALLAVADGEGIEDGNEVGLWSNGMSADGSLELIARQGEPAPGGESGFVFGVFLEPSINGVGQVAFMAAGYRVDGDSVLEHGWGIWGQDRAGQLRLVARTGQIVEVKDDERRTIDSLSFASNAGGEDGKPRGLNEVGQLVFRATFTDGTSGVFISDALTAPEPGSIGMLLLGAALVALFERFRDHGIGRGDARVPNWFNRRISGE